MPVIGLPTTVETALTALLTENTLSSWKIVGEGAGTVVVLRLKPDTPAMSTNTADPILNRSTQVQYRRKPPSQIRRDQKHARQQQQQKQAGDEFHRDCVTPVHELSAFVSDTRPGEVENDTVHTTHTEQTDNDSVNSENTMGPLCVTDETFPDLCVQQSDADVDPIISKTVAGIVKSYVATLTNRSVLRRLRDRRRNKMFRKVVQYRSKNDELLLFESDDLVLEFSCTADPGETVCTYFFVKQDHKHMLMEEREKLASLRTGKRVSGTQHTDIRTRAAWDMDTLHALILFYLG